MTRSEDIGKAFKDRGITLVGSIVHDPDVNRHLVFVSAETDDAGTQTPTNHAIAKVERAVEEEFGDVTVVLLGRGNQDIAKSIKSALIRQYPKEILNVFSSIDRESVSVWVEPKSFTTKAKSDEMKGMVAGLVEYFRLELSDFINTSELNLPSETACVGAIRKKAPATVLEISDELTRRGFQTPSEEWIGRILDRWRKRNFIHRKANGQFVMTLQGLRALGSGKNRRSPDVGRALDMARR